MTVPLLFLHADKSFHMLEGINILAYQSSAIIQLHLPHILNKQIYKLASVTLKPIVYLKPSNLIKSRVCLAVNNLFFYAIDRVISLCK